MNLLLLRRFDFSEFNYLRTVKVLCTLGHLFVIPHFFSRKMYAEILSEQEVDGLDNDTRLKILLAVSAHRCVSYLYNHDKQTIGASGNQNTTTHNTGYRLQPHTPPVVSPSTILRTQTSKLLEKF